jgi:hypothetical protein
MTQLEFSEDKLIQLLREFEVYLSIVENYNNLFIHPENIECCTCMKNIIHNVEEDKYELDFFRAHYESDNFISTMKEIKLGYICRRLDMIHDTLCNKFTFRDKLYKLAFTPKSLKNNDYDGFVTTLLNTLLEMRLHIKQIFKDDYSFKGNSIRWSNQSIYQLLVYLDSKLNRCYPINWNEFENNNYYYKTFANKDLNILTIDWDDFKENVKLFYGINY